MTQFDEDTAIDYMRKAFEAETGLQAEYDDDQLLNIIDMIWDYYEQNGLLDVDSEPDDDYDTDIVAELIDYVTRMLRKDKLAEVKPEHVKPLVLGELAYEDFLDSQM